MQSIQNLGLAIVTIVTGVIVDNNGYLLLEVFFLICLCVTLIAGGSFTHSLIFSLLCHPSFSLLPASPLLSPSPSSFLPSFIPPLSHPFTSPSLLHPFPIILPSLHPPLLSSLPSLHPPLSHPSPPSQVFFCTSWTRRLVVDSTCLRGLETVWKRRRKRRRRGEL